MSCIVNGYPITLSACAAWAMRYQLKHTDVFVSCLLIPCNRGV